MTKETEFQEVSLEGIFYDGVVSFSYFIYKDDETGRGYVEIDDSTYKIENLAFMDADENMINVDGDVIEKEYKDIAEGLIGRLVESGALEDVCERILDNEYDE
jgi:hypothetical protein